MSANHFQGDNWACRGVLLPPDSPRTAGINQPGERGLSLLAVGSSRRDVGVTGSVPRVPSPDAPIAERLYKEPSLALATSCDLVGLNKTVKLIQLV